MEPRACIFLVGAGPGDPELLTLKAHRLIGQADVVVFDRLVGAAILDLIPAGTRSICVGKESGRHSLPQAAINDLLVTLAREGHRTIVRLKGGDPFIFGRGGEEADHIARHGIPFEVVPGITAAAGCAAMTGIPLTHRGFATSVRLVTGHARDDRSLDLDWSSLADPDCTLVVYMGLGNAGRITAELLAHGLPADTPAAAVCNGTTMGQSVHLSRLDRLAADLALWRLQPPTLLIIGKVVGLAKARQLGDLAHAVP